MSPKLPVVSGKQIVSTLESIQFSIVSQRGSHVKLRHLSGKVVIVPLHDELAIGTLKSILRQAELDVDNFLRLIIK